jgi:hypothetical protein
MYDEAGWDKSPDTLSVLLGTGTDEQVPAITSQHHHENRPRTIGAPEPTQTPLRRLLASGGL